MVYGGMKMVGDLGWERPELIPWGEAALGGAVCWIVVHRDPGDVEEHVEFL